MKKGCGEKPNIVFILIDDMGWRDLSAFGSNFYETPNIDALTAAGMKFTNAYSSCPVCSPSRASILTGKYPAAVGVTDWIDLSGNYHPCRGYLVDAPYLKHLPLQEKNLASSLKEGGYRTWHVGKWHLGEKPYYPEHQGFDVNIGGCHWGHPFNGYFSPYGIETLSDGPEGEYLTDRLTDEAINLIKTADSEPFFLNLWHYTVHTPIEAPQNLVEKFRQKAQSLGLDKINPIIEGEHFPTEHKKQLHIQRRIIQSDPVYAAMISNLDTNIGKIVQCLKDCGKLDNTIIVFTSDNGGLSTAEGSPTCNAPASEGKGWMYDGGIRVPLAVFWQNKIKAGSICAEPVTGTDFYPTFLEAAGLPLNPQQHEGGTSLIPLLTQTSSTGRGAIYWHYPHYGNQGCTPAGAVREGAYKLIEFFEDNRLELYNLETDIGEKHNIAAENPAKTQDLAKKLALWRQSIHARIPQKNPDWNKTLPANRTT